MKKIQTILIITIAIAFPMIASASWWNPFSWHWFHKPVKVEVKQEISIPNNIATSTPVVKPKEIKKDKPLITTIKATTTIPVIPEPIITTITSEATTTQPVDIRCNTLEIMIKDNDPMFTPYAINNMKQEFISSNCPITQ